MDMIVSQWVQLFKMGRQDAYLVPAPAIVGVDEYGRERRAKNAESIAVNLRAASPRLDDLSEIVGEVSGLGSAGPSTAHVASHFEG